MGSVRLRFFFNIFDTRIGIFCFFTLFVCIFSFSFFDVVLMVVFLVEDVVIFF